MILCMVAYLRSCGCCSLILPASVLLLRTKLIFVLGPSSCYMSVDIAVLGLKELLNRMLLYESDRCICLSSFGGASKSVDLVFMAAYFVCRSFNDIMLELARYFCFLLRTSLGIWGLLYRIRLMPLEREPSNCPDFRIILGVVSFL